MASIFPFQPYRYSPAAGPLENLVTQPYDKISPAMRARYLTLSPHNLVRIILGERFPSDSEAENVYTRAAAYFRDWIERGVLVRETEPAVFPYFQEFTNPDTGQDTLLWVTSRYDPEHQTIRIIAWTDEIDGVGVLIRRRYRRLSFSWLEPEQTRALLEETGFEIEALYGDFDRSPFGEGSPEQIWVTRRPITDV